MANLAPFFITGANAKVRVNDKVLAFCQDLSYSIVVNHVAPKVLGVYEAVSVEPLSYTVTGSFTVIKYLKGLKSVTKGKSPDSVSDEGNGIGSWGPENAAAKAGFGNDGRAHDNLNPGKLQTGTTFNIEVWQKANNGDEGEIARLRNCRITQADFNISKTSPGIQRFSFTAIYADEDTFRAGVSGTGQTTDVQF